MAEKMMSEVSELSVRPAWLPRSLRTDPGSGIRSIALIYLRYGDTAGHAAAQRSAQRARSVCHLPRHALLACLLVAMWLAMLTCLRSCLLLYYIACYISYARAPPAPTLITYRLLPTTYIRTYYVLVPTSY